jgi:hypothetical protein
LSFVAFTSQKVRQVAPSLELSHLLTIDERPS